MSGTMDCVIAAGVESMIARADGAFCPRSTGKKGLGHYMSPVIRQRFPGPDFSQFTGAEMMARSTSCPRTISTTSRCRATSAPSAATLAGAFKAEIVPIAATLADGPEPNELHTADEGIRFDATSKASRGVKLLREGG